MPAVVADRGHRGSVRDLVRLIDDSDASGPIADFAVPDGNAGAYRPISKMEPGHRHLASEGALWDG